MSADPAYLEPEPEERPPRARELLAELDSGPPDLPPPDLLSVPDPRAATPPRGWAAPEPGPPSAPGPIWPPLTLLLLCCVLTGLGLQAMIPMVADPGPDPHGWVAALLLDSGIILGSFPAVLLVQRLLARGRR